MFEFLFLTYLAGVVFVGALVGLATWKIGMDTYTQLTGEATGKNISKAQMEWSMVSTVVLWSVWEIFLVRRLTRAGRR